jgi:AcrR family transcriptional regulator
MGRQIPGRRFEELADCAARVFIENGYQRTQMADIAAALGVAKGTLYLYVESKEALFDLALHYADAPEQVGRPQHLPIPTPKPGETAAYVRRRLTETQKLPLLEAALARKRASDAARELEEIIREMYRVLAAHRRGIKLLDRSAADHPELAAMWFEGGREGLMALLERYVESRNRAGQLRAMPDVTVAARVIIEMIAFWAVHRHWDPHPQSIAEDVAEDTVVRFVVGALVKE